MSLTDHYAVLGVSPHSSDAEIKTAFRRLAKRYHPDITKNPSSSAQFRTVYVAYDILSDSAKRSRYDTLRQPTPSAAAQSPQEEYERWLHEADRSGEQYAKMRYEDFLKTVLRDLGRVAVTGATWIVAFLAYFAVYLGVIMPIALFLALKVHVSLGIILGVLGGLPIGLCRSEGGASFDPVMFWKGVGRMRGLRQ